MSLRISFELDENDLKHFRLIMLEARQAASRLPPEDIVAAAEELLANIEESAAPGFIVNRLRNLRLIIQMLSDIEWRLPHQEAARVLNALAYFAEPEDLIPDNIPGLGFLDDAIMIELVIRELKHEIEAYRDFCGYRDRLQQEQGHSAKVSRESWLDERRKELQGRMRRRRKRSLTSPFSS
ncbi:MAG: YkvA family protein [Woeseiaceae bacterium]|nr:YkvA family protein [Woeseiaceae bacterium]